ncbi:MAG: PIN domain-containing protein [Fimbriimonadales bacterium]|nr:PIN domain-containing protein [Fimbriimonadales bacterium]
MNRLTQVSGSVLLDTSIAVALMRNDAVGSAAVVNASELFTTDIVLGELYYGAYRSSDLERNLQQVRRFASLCRVLSTNREIAEQYGVLKRALAKAGTPIPENDIWIAATALF